MKCPICQEDTFIEIDAWEPDYMDYGWSIKVCRDCDYKVKDKTIDSRFAGIDHVIHLPLMSTQKVVEILKTLGWSRAADDVVLYLGVEDAP